MSTNTTTPSDSSVESESNQSASLFDEDLYKTDEENQLPEDINREFNPNKSVQLDTLNLTQEELTKRLQDDWEKYVCEVSNKPTGPIFSGKINIDILDLIKSHYDPLIGESRILFTEEGIFIRTADPANIAALTAWISKDDFIEYDLESSGVTTFRWGSTEGKILNQVDANTAVTIESGYKTPGTATHNSTESFEPKFNISTQLPSIITEDTPTIPDPRTDRLEIVIDDGIEMGSSPPDPATLKEQPDDFEVDTKATLTTTGTDLQRILKRINEFTDVAKFNPSPDNHVTIASKDGTADVRKTYKKKSDVKDAKDANITDFTSTAPPGHTTLYSLDYLLDFIKGLRKSQLKTQYTIEYAEDTPLKAKREIGTDSFVKCAISHKRT